MTSAYFGILYSHWQLSFLRKKAMDFYRMIRNYLQSIFSYVIQSMHPLPWHLFFLDFVITSVSCPLVQTHTCAYTSLCVHMCSCVQACTHVCIFSSQLHDLEVLHSISLAQSFPLSDWQVIAYIIPFSSQTFCVYLMWQLI